jgi:3-oxoacyl-[acyl-carrier protein] reductase
MTLSLINEAPVALVTGGGKGIGAACCQALADQGFEVVIHYNGSKQDAETCLDRIKGQGMTAQADLTDPEQIDGLMASIKETYGRLNVLVNNAGFSVNSAMATMSLDAFDRQRALMRGVWYLVKRTLRLFMIRQKHGRIINISSVTAHTGNPCQIPYTMEKAALDALTRSLSRELGGSDILVNSVAPGFIDTDMTRDLSEDLRDNLCAAIPLGRMGQPDEVAQVVAFLASSGTYIHGSVIHVNGGMYGG